MLLCVLFSLTGATQLLGQLYIALSFCVSFILSLSFCSTVVFYLVSASGPACFRLPACDPAVLSFRSPISHLAFRSYDIFILALRCSTHSLLNVKKCLKVLGYIEHFYWVQGCCANFILARSYFANCLLIVSLCANFLVALTVAFQPGFHWSSTSLPAFYWF